MLLRGVCVSVVELRPPGCEPAVLDFQYGLSIDQIMGNIYLTQLCAMPTEEDPEILKSESTPSMRLT